MAGRVRASLDHELLLIRKLDYAPYFLTVNSIVRYARSQDILCQGRGSASCRNEVRRASCRHSSACCRCRSMVPMVFPADARARANGGGNRAFPAPGSNLSLKVYEW